MKIILISPFSLEANNIAGGVAAVTQYLAVALVNLGYLVTVIAPGKNFGQQEQRGQVNIVWSGKPKFPGFITYANHQRKQIFKLLINLKPDVVHFQGVFGWSIHCPYPYVVTIHGIAEKDAAFSRNVVKSVVATRVIRFMENKGRKLAKHVISISPYATQILEKELTGQIHHIDNPIDETLFNTAINNFQRQDKLMCVGVIGERKNTLGVILSFSKIKSYYPSVELVICGQSTSDVYLTQCQQLVKDLGLSKDIKFTVNLSRTELYSQMANAKGLLMMSRQETAPMSIAEAMALGVPCIAPHEFGIPYMIDDGVNGFFVSDDSTDEKWQEISTSLSSDAWFALSDNALNSAKRYHPVQVAKATLSVYESVIKGIEQSR
jgi:glycosyltransferase involved in cell wall biosynthesis